MGMISHLLTRLERRRSRRSLLRLDEAFLADLGYSRALLEDGVRAWPWRLADDTQLGRLKFPAGFRHSYGARMPDAPMTSSSEPPRDAIRAAALLGLGRELQLLR